MAGFSGSKAGIFFCLALILGRWTESCWINGLTLYNVAYNIHKSFAECKGDQSNHMGQHGIRHGDRNGRRKGRGWLNDFDPLYFIWGFYFIKHTSLETPLGENPINIVHIIRVVQDQTIFAIPVFATLSTNEAEPLQSK